MTFYEILGLPANASTADIESAYRSMLASVQAEQATLGSEEYSYRRTMLKLAWETLSDPAMRAGYDKKLNSPNTPADAEPSTSGRSSAVALGSSILARRADALSLRADSLALRADAIAIQADTSALEAGTKYSLLFRLMRYLKTSFRGAMMVLGALFAMSVIGQFGFMYFAAHGKKEVEAEAVRAEDKLVIQEYYQTYGVRPASAAEARLLMAEQQRREREERAAERERQRIEEEERRFKEESRRLGDRVSEDLRREEERIQREKAYERERQAQEERQRAAAEEARVEREQAKWRQVLDR